MEWQNNQVWHWMVDIRLPFLRNIYICLKYIYLFLSSYDSVYRMLYKALWGCPCYVLFIWYGHLRQNIRYCLKYGFLFRNHTKIITNHLKSSKNVQFLSIFTQNASICSFLSIFCPFCWKIIEICPDFLIFAEFSHVFFELWIKRHKKSSK